MKSLPRRNKKSEFTLTPAIRMALEAGSDIFGVFEGLSERAIEAELDKLWKIHGKTVLPEFIARFPGERPPHWWKFDSPEHRPRVAQYDGNDFAEFTHDRQRQRDEELAILVRHKLLSPEEQAGLEVLAQLTAATGKVM